MVALLYFTLLYFLLLLLPTVPLQRGSHTSSEFEKMFFLTKKLTFKNFISMLCLSKLFPETTIEAARRTVAV